MESGAAENISRYRFKSRDSCCLYIYFSDVVSVTMFSQCCVLTVRWDGGVVLQGRWTPRWGTQLRAAALIELRGIPQGGIHEGVIELLGWTVLWSCCVLHGHVVRGITLEGRLGSLLLGGAVLDGGVVVVGGVEVRGVAGVVVLLRWGVARVALGHGVAGEALGRGVAREALGRGVVSRPVFWFRKNRAVRGRRRVILQEEDRQWA